MERLKEPLYPDEVTMLKKSALFILLFTIFIASSPKAQVFPFSSDTIVVDTNFCGYGCIAKPGDVNGDGKYNLVDIVSEVNIVFKGANKPLPECRADANADDKANILDIIYLVNKIFKGGPNPIPRGFCCL